MRLVRRVSIVCVFVAGVAIRVSAQTPAQVLTWPDVRDRFRSTNPTLQAGQIGIEESRATEITAFLRPNPQCAVAWDQIGNTVSTPDNPANAFSASNLVANCSYLHEREHKRELRRDSSQGA